MKTILITGGTGFLGRHLISFYTKSNWNVIFTGRNGSLGRALESETGAKFVAVDLSKPFASEMLNDFGWTIDCIIHSASLSSPWGKYEDFYKNNVIATKNVIGFAIKNQVPRFVHVSTPSIYFEGKDSLDITEKEVPNKFINHYATTKKIAEDFVLSKSDEIEVIGIRPRGIFGEFDTSIIPRIIKIADKGFVPTVNNGNAVIDVTYVGNVVHALNLCVVADVKSLGRMYNVTNDSPKPIKHILKMLFEELDRKVKYRNFSYPLLKSIASILECIGSISGNEPLLTRYGVGLLGKSQTLDISLAKEKLGYSPIYSLEEGIKNYADWRKDNGN